MIYYWKGAEGSASLLATHGSAIERLLSGDYAPADLEKFKHASKHIIYSYRLSKADRLLFTTHKGMLLVLEFIPNHDYQKSRFLKSGVLRQYLNNLAEPKESLFSILSNKEESPNFSAQTRNMNTGLDYYNQQFIHLSSEQQAVVGRSSLPLILNGISGSGKTYVSFAMFQDKLEACPTSPLRCLYITHESRLVDSMRDNWETYFFPGRDEVRGTVAFKTYHDVLGELAPSQTIVSKDFFTEWFSSLKENNAIPLVSENDFYQEFRICSGLTQERYLELGSRQSLIPQDNEAARSALYACYESYLRILGESRVDPAFSPWLVEATLPYDFIVVDEAHRFSLLQNLLLSRLASSDAIVYCLDSHQNLEDQRSTRGLLEVCLRDKHVQTVTLDKAYRYTRHVSEALSQVLENNRRILGGKVDKEEALSVLPPENISTGEFYKILPTQVYEPESLWLRERAAGVHLAVVTQEDYFEEAREVLNTSLVFTPQQIQGQEFHTVVVYRLLSDTASQAILRKHATALRSEGSVTEHRPKDKTGSPHAPWAHQIFTACARAMHTLVIVDTNNDYWDRLSPQALSIGVAPVMVETTSAEDWAAMAAKQAELGNTDIASQIQREKLGMATASESSQSKAKKSPPKSSNKMTTSPPKPVYNAQLAKNLFNLIENEKYSAKKLKKIKELIKNPKINLDQVDGDGRSALILAVKIEQIEVVRALIDAGANIDYVTSFGCTALMLAVICGDLDVAKVLIDAGANLEHVTPNDADTALMGAAMCGYLEIVQALIDAGANVDYMTPAGRSALGLAAGRGRLNVVQALIRGGVDLDGAVDGRTALMLAVINGHVDVALLLIRSGANHSIESDSDGKTVLMLAAAEGYLNIVQALIDVGADINYVVSDNSFTALMSAIAGNHLEIVQALIAAGAHVNHVATNGLSALSLAAKQGHLEIVQALIAAGADVNHLNSEGDTTLISLLKEGSIRHDILDVFLGNHRVLKDLLVRAIDEKNSLLKTNPILIAKLIQKREACWDILKSPEEMGLLKEEHQNLLQDIVDLAVPKAKLDVLHQILFKETPNHQLFALFNNQLAQTIKQTLKDQYEISMMDEQTLTPTV